MRKKSHFRFNKQERNGIFFLLLVLFVFQGIYFYAKAQPFSGKSKLTINTVAQSRLDSLKRRMEINQGNLFPFNPNYITDYKAYTLGMSTEQLDRLQVYRAADKYVNTAQEFQQVTKVSDSLLAKIAPNFKFPDWVQHQKESPKNLAPSKKESIFVQKDLNKVTTEELQSIHGIGETLSKRIIKFRDRLGGFLVNDQLHDVYGLEPQVVERTLERYRVIKAPSITKINVNTANVEQLAQLVYIPYDLAHEIVRYRESNGAYITLDDLKNVRSFPADRIERIKLYLSL